MCLQKNKKLFRLRKLAGIAIFSIALALPLCAFGIGQTTNPIIIKSALRGSQYQETMIIINTEKNDSRITFQADGDVKDWAKFYSQKNLKDEIMYLDMKPGETKNIIVLFSIPKDSPNGVYKGYVSAVKKADEKSSAEGSNTTVSQKIDREVSITVNDQENISFDVSVIPKSYDLAKGEMLSIRLIYDNRGNISISPQAQVRIKFIRNENDYETVYNSIFPYPDNEAAVKPGAIYEIPTIEIPTMKFEKGKYVAELNFSERGKDIPQKKFVFSSDMFDVNALGGLAGAVDKNNIVGGIAGNNLISFILVGLALIGLIFIYKNRMQKAKYINERIDKTDSDNEFINN